MIRPFQLRDMGLVRRLGERGVRLQAQAALTSVHHPVRQAIMGKLVGGRFATYIWKSEENDAAAFAQLSWEEGSSSAHLVCLGTESGAPAAEMGNEPDEEIWLEVLDRLAAEAGSRGVHNIISETAEDGPELPILRKAGFAVYTRQDIWIHGGDLADNEVADLKARQSVDDWDIHVLYANIVPGLIQSVEPNPPLEGGKNLILREEGEMAAFIHISDSTAASWMRLLIHPNAHTKPSRIVRAALAAIPPSESHPMYCCVRRYQSWLQVALEKAGFRLWGSQAVMVRHVARRIEKPALAASKLLDAQAVPSSSSLVQGFSRPNNIQVEN